MSLREDNKKRTRAAILKTARHMFRERGFADTMVVDIADESLVSRQTLYNYFPTKDSLLLGIFDEEMRALEAIGQDEENTPPSPVARLKRFIETYTMDSFEYLDLARHIAFRVVTDSSDDTDTAPGVATKARSRLHAAVSRLVREAKNEGEISKDIPVKLAVDLLLGCYYAVIFESSSVENITEASARARIRNMLDIALRGLAGKP